MLESPDLQRPVPQEDEWRRLFAAAGQAACPCRERTILHLFWSLGLTVPEVLALRTDDIDRLAGRVRWGTGREGALPPEALRVLHAYVSLERTGRGPQLLTDRHGLPLRHAQVSRMFRRLSAITGIAVGPHTLRLAALYRHLGRSPVHTLTALRPPHAAPPVPAAARASPSGPQPPLGSGG